MPPVRTDPPCLGSRHPHPPLSPENTSRPLWCRHRSLCLACPHPPPPPLTGSTRSSRLKRYTHSEDQVPPAPGVRGRAPCVAVYFGGVSFSVDCELWGGGRGRGKAAIPRGRGCPGSHSEPLGGRAGCVWRPGKAPGAVGGEFALFTCKSSKGEFYSPLDFFDFTKVSCR